MTTEDFTILADRKIMTAMLSDLAQEEFHTMLRNQYLRLMSHKTSNSADFKFYKTIHDADGDLMGWVFLPSPSAVTAYPKLKDYEVVVYND